MSDDVPSVTKYFKSQFKYDYLLNALIRTILVVHFISVRVVGLQSKNKYVYKRFIYSLGTNSPKEKLTRTLYGGTNIP